MPGRYTGRAWRWERRSSRPSLSVNPALVCSCLGVCLALAATQPPALGAQRRLVFQHETYLEKPMEVPIDVAVGLDGFVAIADIGAAKVLAFRPNGTFLWEFGEAEAGSGEEELGRVALVDVCPSGDVAVYDSRNQRVILISATGQFVSGRELPFRMGRVDDIVGLKGGGFAIAGRTLWPQLGVDTLAIHVFDDRLVHLRSFGPVPDLDHPELGLWWGVGSLRRTEDGNLMFGRKIPYEILTFTPLGQLKSRLEAPFDIADIHGALRVIKPTNTGDTLDVALAGKVQIPSGAAPIGPGLILSQRSLPQEGIRYWDVFEASGRPIQSERIPDHWLYPLAVGPEQSRVYVLVRRAEEPAVAIVTIRESVGGGH